MYKYCVLLLLFLTLASCEQSDFKDDQRSDTYIPIIKTGIPVSMVLSFCGEGCKRCDFNQFKCLSLLQANLDSLCDNKTTNCYALWLRYSADCIKLCAPVNRDIAKPNIIINNPSLWK